MSQRPVRAGRMAVALAGGLLAVVATGCGGSDSTSSGSSGGGSGATSTSSKPGSTGSGSGTTIDVCAVVTDADAAALFGAPAQKTDPEGTQGGAIGVCIYEGVNEPFTIRNLLQARVYPGDVYYGEKVFPKSQPLAGIGDKAFINVNDTAHVVDIQFVTDGKTGAVNYSGGSSVDVTTKIEPLKAVAAKLAKSLSEPRR